MISETRRRLNAEQAIRDEQYWSEQPSECPECGHDDLCGCASLGPDLAGVKENRRRTQVGSIAA